MKQDLSSLIKNRHPAKEVRFPSYVTQPSCSKEKKSFRDKDKNPREKYERLGRDKNGESQRERAQIKKCKIKLWPSH